MGKEKGKNRLREFFNYLMWLKKTVPQSDGIFVHMHPVYAIIAWPFAKLYRKKLTLWYTHKAVDLKLRVAHLLVDIVFTASKESFRIKSNKVKEIGHGIDVERLSPNSLFTMKKNGHRLVSFGRIAPVKKLEVLIEAMNILINKRKLDVTLDIFGNAALPADEKYRQSLKNKIVQYGFGKKVELLDAMPHTHLMQVLSSSYDIVINLSETGSIDKAVVEAASCGTIVITTNEAFKNQLPKISDKLFLERNDPEKLASRIAELVALPQDEKDRLGEALRNWVATSHNLENLVEKVIAAYK